MYSTCLFCNKTLGSNESLESFPVGRRIAYDVAKGRLWVVSRSCERWNLSPLETRFEVIEEAERAFRESKLRISTDNIAMAQMRDRTELVRIGKLVRQEFAAWRYGDQFGRRWRRYAAGTAAMAGMSASLLRQRADKKAVMVLRDDSERLLQLNRYGIDRSLLITPNHGNDWSLALVHPRVVPPARNKRARDDFVRHQPIDHTSVTLFNGRKALRALTQILPHLNRGGGTRRSVNDAVDAIAHSSTLEGIINDAPVRRWTRSIHTKRWEKNLSTLPAPVR